MADQGRWFKLWVTAPSDDGIQTLPPAHRWAWAVLGCHLKVHGHHGVATIAGDNKVLASMMSVPLSDLKSVIETFPNVIVHNAQKRHGDFTVTWCNWSKYQEDSTAAKRQESRRKKRREEKRREESKNPPTVSSPPFADWPPEWEPVKRLIHELPLMRDHPEWVADLEWWTGLDEVFESSPVTLDRLLRAAVVYCQTTGYRPVSKRAWRQKLRNCLEFEAKKAEREKQRQDRESRRA